MEHRIPCSGGGQLTRRPHALSYDGESVILCNTNRLCVYSTLSGEKMYDLHGHKDEVTSVCLHPKLKNQIYSCSRDGSIKLWNLEDGRCISTWNIPDNLPIEDIVVVNGDVAYVTYFWRNNDAGRILEFDLIHGEAKEMRVKLSIPRSMVCSSEQGSVVIATYDRHTILVWESTSFGRRCLLALHHTKAFTCVAVSQDGTKLAAGDISGRILIWHDIKDAISARMTTAVSKDDDNEPWTYTEPPAATVHWHAHAVGCIEFSGDGRYLLSGGQESVLVLWDTFSGTRGYLPRLGGPIIGISPCRMDPSLYCLRQTDNTVRIVNIASMRIECSIHGVRSVSDDSTVDLAPLIIEPRDGHALIPGPNSLLQFYDICKDRHIDRLQLSRRNIVSMTESSDPGRECDSSSPEVSRIACSKDASLLVSVERQSGIPMKRNYDILKFWDRCPEESRQYGSPYLVNTACENSHRTSKGNFTITDIAIDSTLNIVGTASNSGDFALWSIDDSEPSVRRRSKAWKKLFQASGHHGDSLTSIAFSIDGSLVAVCSDQRASGGISLWDTSSFCLRGELPCPFKRDRVQNNSRESRNYLFFIPSSPLLVLVCSLGIAVYNVISLSIVWSSHVSGIASAASDPHSNHWAIVVSENDTYRCHLQANKNVSSTLLLFQGSLRKPRAGWLIGGQDCFSEKASALNIVSSASLKTSATHFQPEVKVAFVPEKTRPYGSTQSISLPGCSPIIVFSENSNFSTAVNPEVEFVDDTNVIKSNMKASDCIKDAPRNSGNLYGSIFGQCKKTNNMADNVVDTSSRMFERKLALFDLPTHALPSVSNLCHRFLENMLES